MPSIVSLVAMPMRYGSGPKPSQFLPAFGVYSDSMVSHVLLSRKFGTRETYFTQSATSRAKHNMDANAPCLSSLERAPLPNQVDVPRRGRLDTGHEGRHAAGVADAEGPVLETERGVVDGGRGRGVTDAEALAPADARDDANLFVEGELGDGGFGFGVGCVPFWGADGAATSRGVLRAGEASRCGEECDLGEMHFEKKRSA